MPRDIWARPISHFADAPFRWRAVSALQLYPENQRVARVAFHLLRIGISTNGDAFKPRTAHVLPMLRSLQGPPIAVPNWLIVWSKSRDLFLSLAHNPWVYRPN
jgi:hypothetical protein